MKRIIAVLVACLSITTLFSQTLHWNPVSSTTSGSMVLIGKIQINGVDQTSNQLELGVFSGDECRGACIAHLFTYVQPNYYMVDPMVYGDAGDTFTFKLYDHALGQELNLNSPDALAFNENGEGDPFNPYILNFTGGAPEEYTITVSASPSSGGTVSGAGTYQEGSTCTLTATPATGYSFVRWKKNGSQVSTNATYSFTVTENASYVAEFSLNSYTISVSASPTAGGTVSGGGTFNYGSTCTLTANPATGYTFVKWTKNGSQVSTNASYSFTVTANASYVAVFSQNSYTISASASPSAGGSVSGGGTYNYGSTCTLTATPATGYTFVKWTKNGSQVSTNASYSFTVTANASYVAVFSQNSYTISASASPSAGGTVSGGGTYNYGSTCTLTANPATGYTFVKWTKNGSQVSTNASYSFTVTANASYVAVFSQNSYTISASASPTEGGSVSGTGTYQSGSTCTLTATPSTGYNFVKWTKNGTQVSTNASYSFTVTANASYVAVFSLKSYTISASASPTEGGSVSGAGTYTHGSTCTLTATANTGYTFVNWTRDGSVVSNNPSFSITVGANRSYVANFRLKTYTVSASASPTEGGSVSGAGTYTYGSTCTLTATPNTGYTFVNWTRDGSVVSNNPSFSITVKANRSYVANFRQNNFTISASASPTEGGSVSGAGDYQSGSTCTLTATPNTGYNFVKWTKNGTQVSTNASYSFTVTANASYVAVFSLKSYTVSASADPTEGGTISGAGTYTYGSTCTLTATPKTGYTFVNWTRDGSVVSNNPSFSITVKANRSYVANFRLKSYTISASADPTEGGSVSGAGTYNYGSTCTLTATPNTGYTFVNWTRDGSVVSNNPSFSITVRTNNTYVANFRLKSYTISASANPTEGGSVSGAGTYTYGSTCTLTATANTGYTFVNWTRDGSVVSNNPSFSITVRTNNTYVANFRLKSYTISASADPTEGGSISGAGTYNYGSTCTLTATANTGYTFVNWTRNGSVVSNNPSFSITVRTNNTYVANFRVKSYTVSASANPTEGGSVSGAGTYTHGSTCTLTATANTGYTFVNWTRNGSVVSNNPSFSITVGANRTYVANFRLKSYTVSASADPIEGGSVSGAGTYTHGSTCTLTATANTGYTFVNWTRNGSVVSYNPSFSITVRANRTYVANFTYNGGGDDHAYVDLGLPSGLLWATCNVGADNPEDYGDYFAWGETETKDTYNWSTYHYGMGSSSTLTKYCNNSSYGYNGFTDNLTTLLPEDDAATANWGNDWRMPTKEEFQELLDNTTVTWTTQNGVNGCLFTASNGNSIFMPAAGYRSSSSLYDTGSNGRYWSSSLYTDPTCAWYLHFKSGSNYMNNYRRSYGRSVRPVRSGQSHAYVDLGLPSGLLWATCNVGADNPEDYGDYFAWGETETKDTYNWGSYQYCMGSSSTLTKYCNNSSYGYNGFTDNLTTLLPEDDAATANWGNGWRMPTKVEFQELIENTTVTWTTQNGVNGCLFTASNGNSIFMPAAGYRSSSGLYDDGSNGRYWSSTLYTDPFCAWYLQFNSDRYYMNNYRRSYGRSVRPVRSSGRNHALVTVTSSPLEGGIQTVALSPGTNWFSTYVEITLDDLKAALVAAMPNNNVTITIMSQTQNIKYQNGRWVGQLAVLDLAQMYKIMVPEACEITLKGKPIDPTTLSFTITPGINWIAFPYNEDMTVSNFFASFPINNKDVVKSQLQNTRYNNGRWAGQLTTLIPGKGYIFNSVATGERTFVFPTSAK